MENGDESHLFQKGYSNFAPNRIRLYMFYKLLYDFSFDSSLRKCFNCNRFHSRHEMPFNNKQ